jgi:hypothetical protein
LTFCLPSLIPMSKLFQYNPMFNFDYFSREGYRVLP